MLTSGSYDIIYRDVADLPLWLKYSAEYLPDKATAGGILPSSSMIWAIWSEVDGVKKHNASVRHCITASTITMQPQRYLVVSL